MTSQPHPEPDGTELDRTDPKAAGRHRKQHNPERGGTTRKDSDGNGTGDGRLPQQAVAIWQATFWKRRYGDCDVIEVTPAVLNAARDGKLTLHHPDGSPIDLPSRDAPAAPAGPAPKRPGRKPRPAKPRRS